MMPDEITQYFKRALDLLLLNNPFKSSIGVLLGLGIAGLSPLIEETTGLPLGLVPWWSWVSLFVVFLNLSDLFKKPVISPEYQETLDLIERGRREGLISDVEARQRYRLLIQRVIDKRPSQDLKIMQSALSEKKVLSSDSD